MGVVVGWRRFLNSMKTCPRTSTRADSVCSAVLVAMFCAVLLSVRAVGRILIFTILFFWSCFSTSAANCVVRPSLPIHMVGFSSFSMCLTWRFMRVVIGLLTF